MVGKARKRKKNKRSGPLRQASFFRFHQFDGCGIDAIALSCGVRAVREDVAGVRVAAAANDFLARHPVAHVPLNLYFFLIDWSIEARPSGTGMKLCFRAEERLPAADADIRAWLFGAFIFSGTRRLRAFLASHMILLRSQDLAPL